jgi:hypothetical protein
MEANDVVEEPMDLETKRKKRNRTIIIVGIVLVILCVCTIAGISLLSVIGKTAVGFSDNQADVQEVIDNFMKLMTDKNVDKAFDLFSSRAQKKMSISDLEKLIDGSNFALLEGYERLEITTFNLRKAINSNPDLPQGTVAEVQGVVYYEGGLTGNIEAVLEKENDKWRLHFINITVPPEKFEQYFEENG